MINDIKLATFRNWMNNQYLNSTKVITKQQIDTATKGKSL